MKQLIIFTYINKKRIQDKEFAEMNKKWKIMLDRVSSIAWKKRVECFNQENV